MEKTKLNTVPSPFQKSWFLLIFLLTRWWWEWGALDLALCIILLGPPPPVSKAASLSPFQLLTGKTLRFLEVRVPVPGPVSFLLGTKAAQGAWLSPSVPFWTFFQGCLQFYPRCRTREMGSVEAALSPSQEQSSKQCGIHLSLLQAHAFLHSSF